MTEATKTRVDFKKQSMDELMAKVEELSKNPKYKTVKDIEKTLSYITEQEKNLNDIEQIKSTLNNNYFLNDNKDNKD